MLDELDPQQLRQTSVILGIPTEFVRKDFFVTQAIAALINIEDEYFKLIFQGGTSLSKGYQAIHRLSEDIDFRIMLKPAAVSLGKELKRKRLRDFRYALVKALREAEFVISDAAIKVFYEGRFMQVSAEFPGTKPTTYLKPHIAIECFVGKVALEPTIKEVTSLIKVILGEACVHSSFPVSCIALDETAAEKWGALTRRVAATQQKVRLSDQHLVRHLYDLHQLSQKNLLTGEYKKLIQQIMEKDSRQFKKHHEEYINNPLQTSQQALELLFNDSKWQEHWQLFLEQMVYDKNKPNFIDACEQLKVMSLTIFNELTN